MARLMNERQLQKQEFTEGILGIVQQHEAITDNQRGQLVIEVVIDS